MPREHEHELFDNTKGKSLGKAWWNPDTEKIECSNHTVLKMIFNNHSLASKSDKALISNLARAFKSGYITARLVK